MLGKSLVLSLKSFVGVWMRGVVNVLVRDLLRGMVRDTVKK